jgi:hypothetical protein
MKTKIICFLLPLIFFGCSKKQAETPRQSQPIQTQQGLPMGIMPFTVTVVETA